MANVSTIANKLGISASTVSRAIKKPHLVSTKTHELVIKEAIAQGYIKEQKSNNLPLLGIMVADLTSFFSNSIIHYIMDSLSLSDYQTLLSCTNESPINESQILRQWNNCNLHGLIAMPPALQSKNIQEFALTTPTVIIDRDIENINADKVLVNNALGIQLGVEYLKELGHKNILFLSGSSQIYTFAKRYEAAAEVLYDNLHINRVELNKLRYDELYMGAFEYVNTIYHSTNAKTYSAIFAANDAIAAGVLYALSLNNIKLGEDISFICFGDSRWARFYPKAISVINQPVEQIGQTAINHLLERINNPKKDFVTTILDPMLIPRSSTAKAKEVLC